MAGGTHESKITRSYRGTLWCRNGYRMMEEFIYDLPAGRAQDALDAAIRGKGAFRRFKDRLYDFDLQEKWYKYRDDCYEQIARDWCERFGIEMEE